MQHIVREQLYTDVVYRFKYVASFVDFGEKDMEMIKASAAHLAPLVPAVVDAVYQKLFSYDITKAYFASRMEGFSGKTDDLSHLSLGSEQIAFRKNMLSKYLVKLVTSEFNEAFIKYIDWVALIHTDNSNKSTSINVEFIHCNALMGFVENVLIGAISDLPLDADTKKATLLAFNKLLWIQTDLFAQYYVWDGAEIPNARANVKGVKHVAETARTVAARSALPADSTTSIALASIAALGLGVVAGYLLRQA
ncbi:hypothetical protein GGF32_002933 [Allomyces javanicus]|nr:hypothetical protein GGF32_002933 [Allomyces javanicus]